MECRVTSDLALTKVYKKLRPFLYEGKEYNPNTGSTYYLKLKCRKTYLSFEDFRMYYVLWYLKRGVQVTVAKDLIDGS